MASGPKYLVLAILSGLLLTAVNVKPASADPPPWAGRWNHPVKHWHHDDDEDDDDDDGDDDGGHRAYRDGYYGGRYDNGYYGGACRDIVSRINDDRMSIDKIVPTGRHRKALRWYQEDLQKAQRELVECRQGGGSAVSIGRTQVTATMVPPTTATIQTVLPAVSRTTGHTGLEQSFQARFADDGSTSRRTRHLGPRERPIFGYDIRADRSDGDQRAHALDVVFLLAIGVDVTWDGLKLLIASLSQ